MLKQMRFLRQFGRAAKNQHKAAAGGRERSRPIRHGKASRIGRRYLGQVLNREQCDPHRRCAAGSQKDFEIGAYGAGKGVTAQMIQGRRVILPAR
jgi:hypothetical protein